MNKTTQNSLTEVLGHIGSHQNNIVSILTGFQQIISGEHEIVNIDYYDLDGNKRTMSLESNSFHAAEIKRISNALREITNLGQGGNATILNDDSQHYKIIMTSFNKAINGDLDSIEFDDNVYINKYSQLENLMFPTTSVVFDFPNDYQLVDDVIVHSFKFNGSQGFSNVYNGISYAEAKNFDSQKKIVGEWYTDVFQTQKRIQRYHGTFDIIHILSIKQSIITIITNNTRYSDINSLDFSRELYNGDILTNKEGTSKYEVISVDHFKNQLQLKQIVGISILEPGLNALHYYYDIDKEGRELRIPIHANDKKLLFFQPVNSQTSATGEISKGWVIDTSTMVVSSNNVQVPFDSYYNNNVINVGAYLEQLISDSSIPFSQGIKPNKPVLNREDLQVVQINRHLEENSNVQKIQKLSEEKEKIYSDITNLNSQLETINYRLNAGRYRSINDKLVDQQKLQHLISEKSTKTELYSSIVKDIDSAIRDSDLNGFEPKYRVRGFFTPLPPLQSEYTRNQYIIKYDIQYRYTSPTSKTSEASMMRYTDASGNQVSAVFSSWNNQESEILDKHKMADGTISWKVGLNSSDDESHINQIDLPIRPGESIEIRVAACSEAGYPMTYLKSDWSDTIRVDFPPELSAYTSLSDNARQNLSDKQKIELENIISNIGIDDHIMGAFKEQDKYYAHSSHNIASGFRSEEQNTIPLFDMLNQFRNEISTLKATINKSVMGATIELLDDVDQVYKIQNYQSLKLFAGAYTDSVNLMDVNTFGEILTKTFYLRIKNNNTIAIDLLSPKPGGLNKAIDATYSDYFLPNISNPTSELNQQYNGQIIYQRYKDLTNQDTESELFVDGGITNTIVIESDIEDSGEGVDADVYDSNLIPIKLIKSPELNWIGMSKDHPYIKEFIANKKSSEDIAEEFERISYTFNELLKLPIVQNTYREIGSDNKFRNNEFHKNDKFLVGQNSCGARLFMKIPNMENIQVNGSSSNSIRILDPGDQNVILIPITFQFRMTDALGNIDGKGANILSNLEYRKKIGFDMIIADEKFKFDIEVFAKLHSNEIATGSNKSALINRILDSFNSSDSATPEIN